MIWENKETYIYYACGILDYITIVNMYTYTCYTKI